MDDSGNREEEEDMEKSKMVGKAGLPRLFRNDR